MCLQGGSSVGVVVFRKVSAGRLYVGVMVFRGAFAGKLSSGKCLN